MNFTTKEELKTSLDKICKKHLQTLVVTRTVFVTSVVWTLLLDGTFANPSADLVTDLRELRLLWTNTQSAVRDA